MTVGGALQFVLAESDHRTAYVVGSAAVHRHVLDAGLRILNGSDLAARSDVVVVAAHDDFDYGELRGAIQAVLRGAALVCTGRDATFPMPDGPWPGGGPVVAAIEAGTGATATSIGKPEPQLFLTALDRLGPGRALVVGDRLDADAARRARRRPRLRDRPHGRDERRRGARRRPAADPRRREPRRARPRRVAAARAPARPAREPARRRRPAAAPAPAHRGAPARPRARRSPSSAPRACSTAASSRARPPRAARSR